MLYASTLNKLFYLVAVLKRKTSLMDPKAIENQLINTFVKVFECDPRVHNIQGMKYKVEPAWDSFGHMSLMAQISTDFSVELTFDEMISLLSFDDCIKFLSKGR